MEDITSVSIFLPCEILENLSSAYLFGYYNDKHSNIVVNCTFSIENKYEKKVEHLHQLVDTKVSPKLQFIGIIYDSKRKKRFSYISEDVSYPVWFILRVNTISNSFYIEKMYINSTNRDICTNFILYDRSDVLNSSLLSSTYNLNIQNHFIPFLINTLSNNQKLNLPSNCTEEVKDFSFSVKESYSYIFLNCFFALLEPIFLCFNLPLLSFWWCQSLLKIVTWTHVGRQFHQRILHCREIYLSWKINKSFSLKTKNLVYAILFDLICGWLITFTILKSDLPVMLLNNAINYTNYIVNGLQKLIYWLMGVPAGLKLNIPLNSALGHFFLYHIYLWEAYITIVLPVLYLVLKISNVIGIFGFTFFLCLLSDLVSLATVHIYCFYGYATRLYGYQISCLSALWRLFRGKKWNPLRQRVDSYSYDIHQLYLGTLIFTVLLFLLPTVLVYYFVFTCLRILVLIFQGLVSKFVEIFSIFPLYSLILRMANSAETAGDLYFKVFSTQASLVLSMQITQVPFSTVIKKTLPEVHKYGKTFSWKDLLSSILSGDIIYPL